MRQDQRNDLLKKAAYVKNLAHFVSVLLSSANTSGESHDDCIPGLESNNRFGSESLLNDLF